MQPTFEQLEIFSEYTLRFNYRRDSQYIGYYQPKDTEQVSACIRYGSKVALRVRFCYGDRKKAAQKLEEITDRLNKDSRAEKLLEIIQKTVKNYKKSSISLSKVILHFSV